MATNPHRLLALAACLGLSLLVPVPSAGAETVNAGPVNVQTRTLGTGAWCWFNESRALTADGRTVTGWVGHDGSIIASAYDPVTGASEQVNLHPQLQTDDHANPSFYRRQDGRLTAFYSRHAGSQLYYRTTTTAGQFGTWDAERALGTNTGGKYGYTYPNPIRSPLENKLYLFWRGGTFLPTYSTSADDGETWAPAQTLMGDGDPNASMRPYAKYAERDGVIHMAYTQAHPRDRVTSIFYLRYTPGAGWQRAGGALAGGDGVPPFVPTDGDRVYDAWTYGMRSWVHDVAVGADGHPRIVFATFSRSSGYTDHRYWYARWNGTAWLKWQIAWAGPSISPETSETMYSAGITLDPEDPEIVYLSRRCKDRCGIFRVEVWKTTDGGAHWGITPVARGVRPIAPRGATGTGTVPVLYLYGHYGSYTTYRTEVRLSTAATATATPEASLRRH